MGEVKYNEVERAAKVGEKIKIVNAECTFGDYDNGSIMTVSEENRLNGEAVRVEYYGVDNGVPLIFNTEYVVLEPVE